MILIFMRNHIEAKSVDCQALPIFIRNHFNIFIAHSGMCHTRCRNFRREVYS